MLRILANGARQSEQAIRTDTGYLEGVNRRSIFLLYLRSTVSPFVYSCGGV